nr:hypothetical protein [Lachnospiraceae bacterium]
MKVKSMGTKKRSLWFTVKRSLVCIGLSLELVLSSAFGMITPMNVMAASDSKNVNDMTSLDALGISQDKPEDYDQNALNPYGKSVVQMQTVSELFTVSGAGKVQTTRQSIPVTYNQYGNNSALLKGEGSVLQTPTLSKNYTKTIGPGAGETAKNWGHDSTLSMEGNFSKDNKGKKKQVVTFYPYYNENESFVFKTMFDIVDADNPDKRTDTSIEGISMNPGNIRRNSNTSILVNDWDWLSMLELRTGDFDADGIDEILYTTRDNAEDIHSPEAEYVRFHILKLQKQDGDSWTNAANWKEVFSSQISYEEYVGNLYEQTGDIVQYSTAVSVGDFNRDGVDDIATICKENATFFWGARAGDMFKEKTSLQIERPEKDDYLSKTNISLGDVDGDGENEMVIVGKGLDEFTYYVLIYDWDGEKFDLSTSKTFHLFEKDDSGQYVNEIMNGRNNGEFYSVAGGCVNLAVGAFNGFGEPDAIYVNSLLITAKDRDLEITGLYDNVFSTTGSDYAEFNVRASDFDGDGRAVPVVQIAYLNGFVDKTNYPWSSRTMKYSAGERVDVAIPYMEKSGDQEVMRLKTYHSKNMSFALPDIDNDTTYLRYKNVHYYTYSDPKILAVLASPPFFKDLDNDAFDGAGELNCTSYATTKGTGSGKTSSDTFHIGAYVSYQHDINVFGVKVAQVEWETELQNQFTWETERVATKEYEANYETLSGQDTVVLFSVPMETFEFEAEIPVTDGTGKVVKTNKETIGINLPHTPCVKTIALDKYERIAKDFNELPKISDEILTHTVGFPDSYPRKTSELKQVDPWSEVLIAPDMKSAAPATDYGKGAQTHTISMGTEKTDSYTYELGMDFKAGAGVGDFTVGASTGYSNAGGTVKITTSGYSYSAQIYDLPMEAEDAGYGFNWRMVAYKYRDADNEFPIVTYLVNDVTQGPLLPNNFSQNEENTTRDQVALNWEYSGNPNGFIISKYYKSAGNAGFYELAYVKAGDENSIIEKDGNTKTYQYIDEGLEPDTEYQYQIQTVSNRFNVKSVPSETLVCYTLPVGIVPEVKVLSNELTAYPDTPTTLSTYLNNEDALQGKRITYQWQKYNTEEKSWKDLTSKTEASLIIQNAGLDDEGQYRCIVNSRGGNSIVSSKSPVIKVNYAKRQVVCEHFWIDKTNGTANLSLKSKDSNSVPSGRVYFYLSGGGYEEEFPVDLDEKGIASVELDVPDGAYKVTADYQGSRVFSASHYDKSDGNPLFYTTGMDNEATVLDFAKSYTYGDKLNILQYTLDVNGSVKNVEEIDYEDAVFGIPGSTLVTTSGGNCSLEHDMTVDGSVFDSKGYEMADGKKAPSEIVYKFQDPAIIFPNEEMRTKVVERFERGYAAYVGQVYMKYNNQMVMFDVAPKQINLYLDMSEVPEIVNFGEEAERYYSPEAMRSYLTSKEMPNFGEESNNDLDYLDATPIMVSYWGTWFYENATATMEMTKDESLVLQRPSAGSYKITRKNPFPYFTGENNIFRYATSRGMGLYGDLKNLGLNNDISGTVVLKNESSNMTVARLYTAASISNCYEWQDFSKELIVSSGNLSSCTVEAAKVNGIVAGTVAEVSPALYKNYPVGTQITFEASPFEGYEVDYWEVNGKKLKDETSNTLCVSHTLEGTNAVVHFKRKALILSYDISPENATVNGKNVENRIELSPAVKNNTVVTYGASITATALPAEGWHLKEWEYQPEKLAAKFVTDPVYTFEMPNKNVRLYANFERDSYKLSLAEGLTAYDDKGTQIPADTYVVGDTKVTIKKADGYEFTGEPAFSTSVATTDTDNNKTTYTFVMLADTTVNANMEKGEYQISLADCQHGEIVAMDPSGKKVDLRKKLKGG